MVKKIRGLNARDFDNPLKVKIGSPFRNTTFWLPTKQFLQLKIKKPSTKKSLLLKIKRK